MSLINPSIPNLKNLADTFPRGPQYDFAQSLVIERDQLFRRLNALFGSFLEVKQGQAPVVKARLRSLPGSVIDAGTIDGRVIAGRLNKASQTFNSNIVFSTLDYNTVQWTAGTIRFADGTTYAISSGNTGNMTDPTFVYFDPAISTSVLQTTTDYTDTLGENAIIMCNAEDAPTSDLEPFWVAYNSVNLNVNQLSVNYLSALSANMGDLTTGTITLSDATSYIRFGTTPPTSATVGTGLWIDRTGLYGLASDVQTFVLSATDGSLKLRSSTGTKYIDIGVGVANQMAFWEGGTRKVNVGSNVLSTFSGIEIDSGLIYAHGSITGLATIEGENTSSTVSSIGVYGLASGNPSSGYVAGIVGSATINGNGAAYGVYGTATNSGAGGAWAGYFDAGNVYVANQLEVAGNFEISATGSTTGSPRTGAFADLASGNAVRWQFGDAYNAFQLSFDGRLQIYSFWGMEFIGSRQALSSPSFVAGAAGDPAISILSPAAGRTVLVIKAAASQTGDLLQLQNSAGTTLMVLSSAGVFTKGSLGTGFTAVGVAQGGTGLTTMTAGGALIYSTSATALATLSIAAAGNVLTSSGTAPQWSAGYPASAWGSLTAYAPSQYLVDAGAVPQQEVKKRTITVNGVTVTVLVID